MNTKYSTLKSEIKRMGKVIVAYSGGVDSTFLLKTAWDVLGSNVIAVTAQSLSYPKRELEEASAYARELGVKHLIIESEELDIEGFSNNPVNRCYLCKNELFTKIMEVAKAHAIENIIEGSNADDVGDYRPGLKAIEEHQIKSPLRQAGLNKNEIRELSKQLGLHTWNKQPFACLASRFPYGEEITPQKLKMVDEAEQYLLDSGFCHFRVRIHQNLARIETDPSSISILAQEAVRSKIYKKLKEIGFAYISLDLQGYRTGSMNEVL